MKGLRSLIFIPVLFMLASVAIATYNFHVAKEEMRQDLNHALRQFVMDESQQQLLTNSISVLREDMVLTLNDSERRFCSQLTIPSLKDTSHVALCLMKQNHNDAFREEALVCSDTLLWRSTPADADEFFIALKAYSNPSYCSILSYSNQHFTIASVIICLLMLSFIAIKQHHAKEDKSMLPYSFATLTHNIHLTPMQEQLMELFVAAPSHTLTKKAICEALWPKKDHPEDTLYTFISRLKTTLKRQSDMDIVNKRGKEYQLIGNNTTN